MVKSQEIARFCDHLSNSHEPNISFSDNTLVRNHVLVSLRG